MRRPPAAVIEAQLSPDGEPVLGLYLHIAYHRVMSTFGRKVGHGQVSPAVIGVIAMLAERPGVSQARLARLMGQERATIGTTVARAIDAGFVVRTDAHGDARSYALSLSPRGERMLHTLRHRIAEHEKAAGRHLTASESRTPHASPQTRLRLMAGSAPRQTPDPRCQRRQNRCQERIALTGLARALPDSGCR